MFSVLLAFYGVSGHISGLRRLSLVKTIQIITFPVYLHKLWVANVESLMPVQRQCLRYRELPITGDLVGEAVTLEMLEAFMKKLDTVIAR